MTLDLTADEVLTTTRSVRKRLDLTRPVPRELLLECVEIALQAPTGSNSQGWAWMFVEDPAKKQAIADIYRRGFTAYRQRPRSAEYPEGRPPGAAPRRGHVVGRLPGRALPRVPVMLIPLIEGRLDEVAVVQGASAWGRSSRGVELHARRELRGLGSAWTTLHLTGEREVADLLGIPFDHYTQAGLFPVAYTIGTDFKPAARLPAADLVHFDSW